jgi:copper homeostasis protein (lipoprotein)
VSVVFVAGCGGSPDPPDRNDLSDLPPLAAPEPSRDPLANLPATFKGDLPCANCPATRYHLNLFPDQTYNLRVEPLERAAGRRDDMGGWVLSSDHRTLVLKSNRGTEFFALVSGTTLRRLDSDAKDADGAKGDVRRANRFEPIEIGLALRGAYVYMSDAGSFTECATGRRWPVAPEGAHADLERTYLAARPATGQSVVISLEGRIATRTRLDGTGTRPSLIVDRVVGASSSQNCGQRIASVPLEGTDWKLVRVGTRAVSGKAALALDPAELSYVGSGGCNQIAGSYQRNGGQIAFVGAIAERRTCQAGTDVDDELRMALTQVRRWRVLGSILELQDMGGKALARFEADR